MSGYISFFVNKIRLCKLFYSAFIAGALLVAPLSAALARPVPGSFADLSEELLPTVVNIATSQKIQTRMGGLDMPQFPPGSPFEQFFKDFFERGMPNGGMSPRNVTSLGSGFIIDSEGLVVTNNHVIEKADKITVILSDDTALEAEIVGSDKKTDIALLRIKSDKKLKAAVFGDSDTTRVGDWVLAIGNPFGLGSSVTAGILSARARDIQVGPYDDFMQTDAPINRGNSGGPLFDMDGKVIGVNTAIFSPSGGSVGIGFAVPANMVKWVVDNLLEHGRIRRGWLGVRIQTITDDIAESLGLDKVRGALVASVNADGPAKKAAIKPGDVILEFDGTSIDEMRQLPRKVAETDIGKAVPVVVWRDGKRKNLKVVLGEMENEQQADTNVQTAPPLASGNAHIEELGVTVSAVSVMLRERYNLPEDVRGVVVTDVAPDSEAAEKGVMPGDVIVDVNQHEVVTPEHVAEQVAQAKKAGRKNVLLLVEGRSGPRFFGLKIDE